MPALFSTSAQLIKLSDVLTRYMTLPFFDDKIPGGIMEAVLAYIRHADVLRTYDFVDVVKRDSALGWQVKATKKSTPLTWKRAKIPNALQLIKESHLSERGMQNLGDEILHFCNSHARHSMELYNLEKIGYARLILDDSQKTLTYFERELCERNNPVIFDPQNFVWHWTQQKQGKSGSKEQLSSLHGMHKLTNVKWFAWHGLGENQLHFSGEQVWWPNLGSPHMVTFDIPAPSQRLTLEQFIEILSRLDEV
ncbi:hypothetical protein IAD21_04820 [Abditibacteriota bacterium]|nr:hypothetical protein IAD21_04820 [Abditibacteriota bacterium]